MLDDNRGELYMNIANEEMLESSYHTFETGKREECWEAKWITCEREERRLPFFEKLRILMANAEVKELLYKELPAVENFMSYTGDYPLSETPKNLSYEEEFIEKLGEKIAAIL